MYGENRQFKYFIGFGLAAVLLIVVIILIMTSGGGRKAPITQSTLMDYANDGSVSVSETIIGPIVAPENHARAVITVSNQSSEVTKFQGYDGNVIANQSYPMSVPAFSEFLAALYRGGFTKGNTSESLANDKGFCPLGQRFIFSIEKGGREVQRFWATSCGGTKTFQGSLSLTLALFRNQIPDYGSIVGGAQNDNPALAL